MAMSLVTYGGCKCGFVVTLKTWSFQGSFHGFWVSMFHVNVCWRGLYPSPDLVMKSIPKMACSVRVRKTKNLCWWKVPWMLRGSCMCPRICRDVSPAAFMIWLLVAAKGVVVFSYLNTCSSIQLRSALVS